MKVQSGIILNSNQNTYTDISKIDDDFLSSAFSKEYKNAYFNMSSGPTLDIHIGSAKEGLKIQSISATYTFAPGISSSSSLSELQNQSNINSLYGNSSENTVNDKGNFDTVITIKPDGSHSITLKPSEDSNETNFKTESNSNIDVTPSKVNYKDSIKDVFDVSKAKPSEKEVLQMIDEIAPKYNLDPALIKAMVKAESSFNNQCISRSGAVGLMQLMPDTAREMGLKVNSSVDERWDPRKNLEAGIAYISKYKKIISSKLGSDDLRFVIAGYNCGPNRVIREGKIPNISETKNYVKRVLSYMTNY